MKLFNAIKNLSESTSTISKLIGAIIVIGGVAIGFNAKLSKADENSKEIKKIQEEYTPLTIMQHVQEQVTKNTLNSRLSTLEKEKYYKEKRRDKIKDSFSSIVSMPKDIKETYNELLEEIKKLKDKIDKAEGKIEEVNK